MTVFELAMQGRAHLRENIPCQDKTSTSERNGVRCIALADGAGSASLSHFGAQAAVEAITELLSERFAEFYNSPAAEDVKSSIVLAIYTALEATRETCGCQMSDLASTLLFVAVKDNAYIIGQIGDGVIVSVYGFLDTFLLIKPRCSRPLSGWPAPLTESCSRGVQ